MLLAFLAAPAMADTRPVLPAPPRGEALTAPVGLAALAGLDTVPATAQFRGGAHHPGAYEGGDFSRLERVAWSTCTGGTVRSSAAVVDGTVYIGSGGGHLYAFDLETGAMRWRYPGAVHAGGSSPTGSAARAAPVPPGAAAVPPVTSSPAVAAGLVVAVDREGTVHAVWASNGVPAWTVETREDRPMPWGREGWDYFTGSPAVVGNTVVIGGGDGVLRWMALHDGRVLRSVDLGTRLRSSPAVANGHVYIGGADGVVYAVDGATGEIAWRHQTEGAGLESAEFGFDRRTVQSSPAVVDGVVYIGGRDAYLYALDAGTGERQWRAAYTPSWVVSSPAVGDGVVFTGTSDAHVVQALDARTGEVFWSADIGTRVLGSTSLVGDVLLVPGNDAVLRALDAGTGEELWRYRTAAMIQSSPVVAGDLAIFGDDAGAVHALRAGRRTPRLAVFRDSATAELSTLGGGDRLHEDLTSAGYASLDAAGLARFMEARLRDGAPGVVVFAQDYLPPAAGAGPALPELLRRYLEAGGKVVWPGYPPQALVRDSTGRPVALELDRAALVAGTRFAPMLGDYGALPTEAGRRWGLDRVRVAAFAADSVTSGEVLARDELGRPGAFVRSFGGPDGTGFVYLWGRGYESGMLPEVRRVAEHGVLRDSRASQAPIGACPGGTR